MDKAQIIKRLQQSDSTILSFPDRGPWGDFRYRGNCSGWIQAFLIWKYHVRKMAELFSGSGTGYDVAQDMEVQYIGADLNPSPVRPGILSVDAMEEEVPEGFMDADFIFMHPPYSNVCRIHWAGERAGYPDPSGDLKRKDLGNMPWDEFMAALNKIVMKYYSALMSGGRMGILMGDVRRGKLHSMLMDIVKPGQLEQVIIKAQHNTTSTVSNYSNKNFVPISHEYLLVLKKISPYIINFSIKKDYAMDIRDSRQATWKDVVAAALSNRGGIATLDELYAEIEGHQKCKKNAHWKAKIRQTLQINPSIFIRKDVGLWQFSAA